MMSRVAHRRPLVIGVGQELRGDDAVGRRVAEAFQAAYPELADVVSLVQLVPELAERISVAESVTFIDAREGGEPGQVEIQVVRPRPFPANNSHVTTAEELLAIALTLYGFCPRAALVTVTGDSFDLSESLSPFVRDAIPQAVRVTRSWLIE